MGPPPALIESFQAAGFRALELLALRQSLLSAVPPCPAVSLACPPANVSCPPPPACPVPLVNISCPPAVGFGGAEGVDVPSAFWGTVVGTSAGLGLGAAAWRRGRAITSDGSGVSDRAREQLQLIRKRHGEGR